jgi:hypothetical protein
MWRPLFLLGNKRSGTSHLMRLLNAHPKIYVAPEADLIWALYCRSRGGPIESYPMDGPRGLAKTMDYCGNDLADQTAGTQETFARMLSIWARHHRKNLSAMEWAGDKKPVQHADPKVFAFIQSVWPDARFVHIIRHPAAVIASKKAALANHLSFMRVWNRSDEELLAFWTENELRVLAHKAAGAPIFSLTLPALIRDPGVVLAELLKFLNLSDDPGLRALAQSTTTNQDDKYVAHTLSLTPEAQAIVEHYVLD